MKLILMLLLALIISSCAHKKVATGVSITSASNGLMKNSGAEFPVYLTDKIENREALAEKFADDLFLIHTGHVLKPNLSKAENEKNLEALSENGFNLVNLTLEDFIIAENQKINFETYEQINFLNSSVIDVNLDGLATAKNILPSVLQGEVAFIGLSDATLDKKLNKDKFIINDYVLAILKVKKAALKEAAPDSLKKFIIVHTLGSEINEVMVRLPPSFINSLAN